MATRKHTYHKEFYTITNTQISSSDLQYLFNVRTGINYYCENGDGDSCRGRVLVVVLRKHCVLVRMFADTSSVATICKLPVVGTA